MAGSALPLESCRSGMAMAAQQRRRRQPVRRITATTDLAGVDNLFLLTEARFSRRATSPCFPAQVCTINGLGCVSRTLILRRSGILCRHMFEYLSRGNHENRTSNRGNDVQ